MSIQLIDCPACGSKVSSQAVACPHCGQPLRPVLNPVAQPQPQIDNVGIGNARILSILSICFVVGVFWGGLGILFLIAGIVMGHRAVKKGDNLGKVGYILGYIALGIVALVLLVHWIELNGGVKENIGLIGVVLFVILAIVTLLIEENKKNARRH